MDPTEFLSTSVPRRAALFSRTFDTPTTAHITTGTVTDRRKLEMVESSLWFNHVFFSKYPRMAQLRDEHIRPSEPGSFTRCRRAQVSSDVLVGDNLLSTRTPEERPQEPSVNLNLFSVAVARLSFFEIYRHPCLHCWKPPVGGDVPSAEQGDRNPVGQERVFQARLQLRHHYASHAIWYVRFFMGYKPFHRVFTGCMPKFLPADGPKVTVTPLIHQTVWHVL